MTTQAETWVPELTLGARLALVRQRMGWNIKEAATECGVPAQSWRGWEVNGRAPHNLVTIAMTIATRTGVDIDWLVYGHAKPGLNERYPLTVADLVAEPIPSALHARLIERVKHGDGRRKGARPISGVPVARAVNPGRPTRRKDRPVSRIAAA